MSGQKINIKLGDQTYPMTAETEKDELRIRQAAKTIEARLSVYAEKYPGLKSDKFMPFIALNATTSKLLYEEEVEALEKEVSLLHTKLEDYLKHDEG